MGCDNSSNGTWPGRLHYTVHTWVPLTILVAILILLTVLGNALVVIAVFTSRALRAPQNLFLVSLACADILVATLVIPFSLSNELLGHWSFGKVWCEIYLALDVLFCTSSIVHLCAISLDRYWSVTQAVKYNQKRTPRRIKCMVLTVWVLAAIISFPPLISVEKKVEEVKVEEGPTCKLNGDKWYIIFSSTASFFAPCVIMILVYVKIYQVAKKTNRALPGTRRTDNGSTDERPYGLVQTDPRATQGREGEEGRDGEEGVERVEEREDANGVDLEEEFSSDENNPCSVKTIKSRGKTQTPEVKPENLSRIGDMQPCVKVSMWRGRQHREKRFTLVLAVVMGVFVVCWFPFFFTYTLKAVCDSCCVPQTLFTVFFWFGYCNSSLNPLIYTIFNQDFRRSFKRILCRRNRRGL